MLKKQLIEDNNGMVFSIDLLLSLIVITVIIGVSANTMDIIGSKMQDYSYANNLERITTSGAELLVKTPGSPENWEELRELDGVTPGLAEVDSSGAKIQPNTLSTSKINRLKGSYDTLISGKVIPSYYNSTMVIYPTNPYLEPISVKNTSINPTATNLIVVNRTVLCNYLNTSTMVFIKAMDRNSTSLKQNYTENCPHHEFNGNNGHVKVDYKNEKPGWACYHFRVTREMLESTDFYLMTDPDIIPDPTAGWTIDRPENISNEFKSFNNKPIHVNERIIECVNNNSTVVLWLHVFSSGNLDNAFNTYLAGFPKDTPTEKVKVPYLTPQPCYFVFKVWE